MSEGTEDREAKFGAPPPERTLAQRWVLATQGVLTELNQTSHLRIGGEPRPLCSGLSAFRLRRFWGVRSEREARARIKWLLSEGHRFAFAEQSDQSPDDFIAWDLVRAACVAGWAYAAYHIERDEAWQAMVEAARGLRAHYNSWQEVGLAYAAGKSIWSGESATDVEEVTRTLCASGGGWDLSWDIDLSSNIPAPDDAAVPELIVDIGGNGDFKSIAEALAKSKDAKRVVVRAGVYDESVRIHAPIELVADGDVTIRNGSGAPLAIYHHALVKGFRLEAGHDDDGEKMQAIWVGATFAKIVDCTMTTERCGVYAGHDRSNVLVQRCRVQRPGIHAFMTENDAALAIVDCEVDHPVGSGLFTEATGDIYIDGMRITDGETPAITIRGEQSAELHDVTIRTCASNGLEVLGNAHVAAYDLIVEDCAGTGALFGSAADDISEIHTGKLTGNAGNDIGVISGGLTVHAAKLGGGPSCAVATQNDARLQLEGCEIAPTTHPLLYLMGTSLTVLIDCKMRSEGELAIFGNPGAAVRIVSSDIQSKGKPAVLLRGVGPSLILGSRIAGTGGGLFMDEGSRVIARDVELVSDNDSSDADPVLTVRDGADLAWIGGSITTAGKVAAAVEENGRLSLTRTTVRGSGSAPLSIDGGHLRVLGGDVPGSTAIDIDEQAFAPFALTLKHGDNMALEIDVDCFRPAFEPLGAEPPVQLCPLWCDLALTGETFARELELDHSDSHVLIETSHPGDLERIAGRLSDTLSDPKRCASLAAALQQKLERDRH